MLNTVPTIWLTGPLGNAAKTRAQRQSGAGCAAGDFGTNFCASQAGLWSGCWRNG